MHVNPTYLTDEVAAIAPLVIQADQWFARVCDSELALVYHADPDGVVSAAFIDSYLQNRFERSSTNAYWVGTHEFDFAKLSAWIDQVEPKFIALFDVNIVENIGILSSWSTRGIRVLIYDDHDVECVRLPKGVTYLSPNTVALRRSVPPCLFAGVLVGLDRPQHIVAAAIGIIGENLADEYSDILGSSPLPRRKLNNLVRLIVAFYLVSNRETDDLSLRLIRKIIASPTNQMNGILASELSLRLREYRAIVDIDIEKNIQGARRWINERDSYEFLLKEVTANSRVVGLVASTLRNSSRRAISIAYQLFNDRIVIEARRAKSLDSIHLVILLRRLTSGIEVLNLGGHPPAAGAAIRSVDQPVFLSNVCKWVEEWSDDRDS